jgi:hypothetical protein
MMTSREIALLATAALSGCLGAPLKVAPGAKISGVTATAPVVAALAEQGFTIKVSDAAAGLVNTEAREREVPYGRGTIAVRDAVQATVGPSGAFVQYTAECRLQGQPWDACRDLGSQTIMHDMLTQEHEKIRAAIQASGTAQQSQAASP